MNMDEIFRLIDEAFAKERAEQERLIIKEMGGKKKKNDVVYKCRANCCMEETQRWEVCQVWGGEE